MLRLGVIDYINSLPLVYALQHGAVPVQARLFADIPSSLNWRLREGGLDAAFISSAEYLAHPNKYARLPDLCIGAYDRVLSVCLFSRCPIEDLGGRSIALTGHSATSRLLLQVLCQHYWQIEPIFHEHSDDENLGEWDGVLLIGDECLQKMDTPGLHCTDLAHAWYQATGLPFVFGLLAVRREVLDNDSNNVQNLSTALHQSLEWAEQRPEQIVDVAHAQSGLPKELLRRYYMALHYRLDASMLEGLAKFSALSAEFAPRVH